MCWEQSQRRLLVRKRNAFNTKKNVFRKITRFDSCCSFQNYPDDPAWPMYMFRVEQPHMPGFYSQISRTNIWWGGVIPGAFISESFVP